MLDIIIQAASTFGEVIAVVVTGFSAWVGYKQLTKRPEQQTTPGHTPPPADSGSKDKVHANSLIVFETDSQRTTLRATPNALECYLFDSRPDKSSAIQWRLPASKVRDILKTKDFEIKPGYKVKTGTFRIGGRRNWLYSKLLFPEPNLLEQKLLTLLSSFDGS